MSMHHVHNKHTHFTLPRCMPPTTTMDGDRRAARWAPGCSSGGWDRLLDGLAAPGGVCTGGGSACAGDCNSHDTSTHTHTFALLRCMPTATMDGDGLWDGLWDGLRDVPAQNGLWDGPASDIYRRERRLRQELQNHHALATKNLMDIALLSWGKMLLRACLWTP